MPVRIHRVPTEYECIGEITEWNRRCSLINDSGVLTVPVKYSLVKKLTRFR